MTSNRPVTAVRPHRRRLVLPVLVLLAAFAGPLVGITTSTGVAQANVDVFTNRTIADGLGSDEVFDVFVVGTTVYAGTYSGLGIGLLPPLPSQPPPSAPPAVGPNYTG